MQVFHLPLIKCFHRSTFEIYDNYISVEHPPCYEYVFFIFGKLNVSKEVRSKFKITIFLLNGLNCTIDNYQAYHTFIRRIDSNI